MSKDQHKKIMQLLGDHEVRLFELEKSQRSDVYNSCVFQDVKVFQVPAQQDQFQEFLKLNGLS